MLEIWEIKSTFAPASYHLLKIKTILQYENSKTIAAMAACASGCPR